LFQQRYNAMVWDRIVDMKTVNHYESHSAFIAKIKELLEEKEDEHELFSDAKIILDIAYKKVTPEECAEAQTHLSAEE